MASTKSKNEKSKRRKKKLSNKGWRTAETADRHELYEKSVQNTESEIDFVDQVWNERRGRHAVSLREDFCGTAQTSVEWVLRRDDNRAIGVDLDEEVVAWGRDRNQGRLDEDQTSRFNIVIGDVLSTELEPVETVLAMNFSYYLFKTRESLRGYFKTVHAGLADDGIFFMDAYGGSESFEEMEEERNFDGFTYVWDQHSYNPVTGDVVNKIHFRFPDGTEMSDAFIYEWRLWTLPELQELLVEAGFSKVTVYWEGTDDETEEGDGVFVPTTEGEACAGWIAYIVAEK